MWLIIGVVTSLWSQKGHLNAAAICHLICCISELPLASAFVVQVGFSSISSEGRKNAFELHPNSLHKPLFSHEAPLLPYVFSSLGTKVIGFYSWRWHLFFAMQTLTTGIWMEHGSELWWTYGERKLVVVDISKNLTTFLNNTFEDLLPFSWILCNMILLVLWFCLVLTPSHYVRWFECYFFRSCAVNVPNTEIWLGCLHI